MFFFADFPSFFFLFPFWTRTFKCLLQSVFMSNILLCIFHMGILEERRIPF